jgi:hypothetical protein
MLELGHTRLDLLKLDIEGAESEVIDDLLVRGPLPKILCVEFDRPEPIRRMRTRLQRLSDAGYLVRAVEGLNVTFCRQMS